MICSSCGAEWPDDVRFCGACGARMPDATVVLSPEEHVTTAPARGAPPTTQPSAPSNALKGTHRLALAAVAVAEAADATAPATAAPPSSAAASPIAVSIAAATASVPLEQLAPLPPTMVLQDTVLPTPQKHLDGVLAEAWGLCDGRRGLLALGTLIVILASAAAVGTLVGIAALWPLWGGLVVVGLRVGSGRPIVFDDFFAGVRCFVPLAVVGALSLCVVLIGTVALVVPGLYLATVSMYAPFLVLDRGLGPLDAWRLSRATVHEAIEGHAGLVVVLMLMNVGGLLPLGLGLLVTIPFTFVAVGVAYGRFLGYAGGVDQLTA